MNNLKTKLMATATAALLTAGLLAGCSGESTSSGSAPTPTTTPTSASAPAPQPISVISREDGSGTRGAFIELFGVQEKGADGTKIDHTTTEATTVNKTDVMLQTVAGDPTAIGYVSLGSMNDSVKALQIDGVTASAENMLSGSYKISRPFNIATKGEAQGLAKDFMDFILSAEGQAVVAKSCVAVNSAAPAYSGSKPAGKLTVGGSSSVYPVMEKLKEAYETLNPNATLELQSSDSTAGMSGTMEGIFDMGMASRELSDKEKTVLTGVPIAIDGIAVIVNPANPVTQLSREAVKNIFTGVTLTWDQPAQ